MKKMMVLGLMLMFTSGLALGQEQGGSGKRMIKIDGKPGEVLVIPELGLVIQKKEDKSVVTQLLPAFAAPKDFKQESIHEGDQVTMVNGKKITALPVLINIYDNAKPGETIKLAIQGSEMMLLAFEKADPSKLPIKRVIKTDGGSGAPKEE